jgi:signal transduction histidine kinase
MAKLRPRARIIRTIGDQLISGPEAALIELVKNAYDADASTVRIAIVPKSDSAPSFITVSDDGHGMSASDVLGKWLEPATADKIARKVSPFGRRLLGAKGVGRFATARLGKKVELLSRMLIGKELEVSKFELDWDDFERHEYLDQIDVEVIASREPMVSEDTGVSLKIVDLRDTWTQKQLESLVKELRRLSSPKVRQEAGFRILLDLSGFTEAGAGFDGALLVSGRVLGENGETDIEPHLIRPFSLSSVYHYRLEGKFDSSGGFLGRFVNKRADGAPQEVRVEAPSYLPDEVTCGDVSIAINIYDREPEAILDLFKRMGLSALGRVDARKILDENIGVGIYRDGFRIRPYGDAETDWLELERKRVQNPSQKLGLNQLWGEVFILDEGESGLVERSSREGLEHNGSFVRLRRLLNDVMARVELVRLDFRGKAGLSRRAEGDAGAVREKAGLQSMAKAIERLPVQYRDGMRKALRQESAALKTSIVELENFQLKLAAQSSIGLVVSQVLHDGRRFLGDINTRSKTLSDGSQRLLEQSPFGEHFRSVFGKNAASIKDSASHLTRLFRALDPLASRKRGRPKTMDPVEVVRKCVELNSDALREGGISLIEPQLGATQKVTIYEADLMAAVLNILDNAIHWLGTSDRADKQIVISASESKRWVKVSISNNGPAVDSIVEPNLFRPGFTLKTEGSGIGLAIAREAMKASKGKVEYDAAANLTSFSIYMKSE